MTFLKRKSALMLIAISVVLMYCFSAPIVVGEPIKIMPLGDSITRGNSPGFNGYRKPLYLNLTNNGYDVDFVGSLTNGDFADPNHEGHGSWHADTVGPNDILGQVYNFLVANHADIILLHIGTNDIACSGEDANEISDILDEIDRYESDYSTEVTVLVARITKFAHTFNVTPFNDDVQTMALDRISNPNNPAYPDKVVCPNDVDMENALEHPNDFFDWVHPNVTGYAKMADVWYNALLGVLPDSNTIIEYDAASSNSISSDGNTLTWQHTIGSGDNRILVVGIAGEDSDSCDLIISSVEYNDVNMEMIEGSSQLVYSASAYTKTELYYLLDSNLPSSGSYMVEVTYSGSVSKRCGGAISLINVEQQPREAVDTNSSTGTNSISTTITTLTSDAWLVDVVGCSHQGSFTDTSVGMIERFDTSSDSSAAAGSTKYVRSAGLATMSWDFNYSADRLAHSVAAFAPAPRTITGCISESNDAPIEGAVVLADNGGDSDITDSNGYYEVLVPYSWSGVVTPTKAKYSFQPMNITYNNPVTADKADQDYIGVNCDLHSDGVIDWLDIAEMQENWLDDSGQNICDLNTDGNVDWLDFAIFSNVW